MNTGLTEAQMQAFIEVLNARVGTEEAARASGVLSQILAARRG